jgi:hypothetical protein
MGQPLNCGASGGCIKISKHHSLFWMKSMNETRNFIEMLKFCVYKLTQYGMDSAVDRLGKIENLAGG